MSETIQTFLGTQLQQISEDILSGEYGENNNIDITEIETQLKNFIIESEFITDYIEEESENENE
tara:strand:+ start:6734 stop:6925 length:192 start_codon:yes stop_codon:yes gene_type:complete